VIVVDGETLPASFVATPVAPTVLGSKQELVLVFCDVDSVSLPIVRDTTRFAA
jgi:hypothetical protein